MPRRAAKVIGLIFMALTLVALPVVVGCGDDADADARVTIGFLGDFTGPGAETCIRVDKGMRDFLRHAKEHDPIPGVDLRVITYDSRLEYSRVVPGYLWLKGQGSDIILNFNAMYTPMLVDNHQRDGLASFCFNAMQSTMGEDYMYSFSVDYITEGEASIEWLVRDWEENGEDRPMKLGYVGLRGMVSDTEIGNVMKNLAETTYKGQVEFNWQSAPLGTTTWSNEINRLRGSDVIFLNLVGPSLASFLNEAVARGYEGGYLGSTISLMGFWSLVRGSVPLDKIDGIRAIHAQMLWTDGTEFMDDVEHCLQTYRAPAEAANLKMCTSYPSGYLFAWMLYETVKLAADKVGPENVDSEALNQALQELEMDVDGWGEPWKACEDTNVMHRTYRIIEYVHDQDDWFEVDGGGWFLPENFK